LKGGHFTEPVGGGRDPSLKKTPGKKQRLKRGRQGQALERIRGTFPPEIKASTLKRRRLPAMAPFQLLDWHGTTRGRKYSW